MAWEDFALAFGGALEGGMEGYQWLKNLEMQKEVLKERARATDVRAQTQLIVQELRNLGLIGREEEKGSQDRQTEGVRQGGRVELENVRHGNRMTHEGFVQENLNFRFGEGLLEDQRQFNQRDATTRRGQDITSSDRRYGIDTTSQDRRYGIDTGRTTALDRIGADNWQFGESLKMDEFLEAGRNWRDVNGPAGGAAVVWGDPANPPSPAGPAPSAPAPAPPPVPAARPPTAGPETAAASPSGGTADTDALRSQMAATLTALKAATTNRERLALRRQLAELRQQYRDATGQ